MALDQRAAPPEGFMWLLMQVSSLSRRIAERRLAPAGMTPEQAQALRLIAAARSLTVGELARTMGLERNSASQLVERLVRQNLVKRERSTADRRQVFVRVDAAGAALLTQGEPLLRQLAADLLADLPAIRAGELAEALSGMLRHAERLLQDATLPDQAAGWDDAAAD